MFDTMTLTKVVGSLCGAFLVLLLGKWAAETLYHVDDHGEQAYAIAVEEEAPAEEAAEPEVSFEEVFASADPGAGERLWRQCQACHKLEDGANATGPHLYDLVGREIASVDGFSYSDALAEKEGDWTPEAISAFIEAPRDWAPGTKMSYNGLDDIEDRANLIAYIEQAGS